MQKTNKYVRVALAVILIAWRPLEVISFLTSTTIICCWESSLGEAAGAVSVRRGSIKRSSLSPTPVAFAIGQAVKGSSGVRLDAVRDDCKSCMDQDMKEKERKMGGDTKGERRISFEEERRREKSQNVRIALGSFLSAVGLFFLQHSVIAPAQANPVLMLRAMESTSTPLAVALTNGRPTVVDFYADWCENCKIMAPTMREIEEQFKNQINFVVVDGAAEKNYDLVDAFKVDGIPHLAMVNAKGEVETAIIGAIPKEVVVDDIKALLAGHPLPYTGFDLFEGEDHGIKGQIEMDG